MAIYPPPNFTEDINTFNPINWELSSTDGITEAFLNANFLKFPIAQGFETLNGINNLGSSTLSGAVNIQGLTTFNNNLVLQAGLPARTITFSDGTVQSSAAGALPPSGVVAGNYTLTNLTVASTGLITSASNGSLPASGVVAGAYTNTNITVNSAGIITSATSGASPTPTLLIYDSVTSPGTFTPAFPAGTLYVDMALMGGGGASGIGGVVQTGGTAGSALGGAGGGGGCVYIQRLPVQGTATLSANITVGVSVSVNYTGSYGGTNVATAYWGGAGGNGVFANANNCVGGAGGAGGGTIVAFVGQGQTGTNGTGNQQQNSVVQASSPPPWNLINKSTAGGFSYLAKGFGNSVQGLTYGASSTLDGMSGNINYAPAGVGGIYFWCYSS